MIYLRCALIFFWLALCSLVSLVLVPFRWGNFNLNRDFARAFGWGALKILGIKIDLEGKEQLEAHQPCVYVANHQSAFDMVAFGSIFPGKTLVIGKRELIWVPFFGLYFAAAGNIMIVRQNRIRAVAGLSDAVRAMKKKNSSVWIFPEGTRNRSSDGLLSFKKGAFHMAIEMGIPVVPVICSPHEPLVSWKHRRMLGGTIQMRVLPPVSSSGLKSSDIDNLCFQVREKMLEALPGLKTQLN